MLFGRIHRPARNKQFRNVTSSALGYKKAMTQYYDPNDGWRPPPRRNKRQQSLLSIALEAAGGGLVIALIILGLKRMLGF